MSKLAVDGGTPVRAKLLPYGRQWIDEDDKRAVLEALDSDYLTTGPRVAAFEAAIASTVSAKHAVAISNGTAALHAAYYALGISPGDEVIVPAMTFAATANAAVYCGAKPVFADVDEKTLLLDPKSVARLITKNTKAIAGVDYTGQPCDYDALRAVAGDIPLVADACHAIGGRDEHGRKPGQIARLSTFSFHPVKAIATGEGGAITTDDDGLAARMRVFRNHGITTDHRQRELAASYFYEMVELGMNLRISDINCALGTSQLKKLETWTARRQALAKRYDEALQGSSLVKPLAVRPGVMSAYHLYVVQLQLDHLTVDRDRVFQALRAEGIGVNVHYIPVHHHPYYRKNFGTHVGQCPVADAAFTRILTLPLFARMTDSDVDDVVAAVDKVTQAYRK